MGPSMAGLNAGALRSVSRRRSLIGREAAHLTPLPNSPGGEDMPLISPIRPRSPLPRRGAAVAAAAVLTGLAVSVPAAAAAARAAAPAPGRSPGLAADPYSPAA